MSFSGDLNSFERRAINERYAKLKINVGIALFSAVIKGSPVGDPDLWKSKPPKGYVGGRFRANWMCSKQAMSKVVSDEIDPSGSSTISEMINIVSGSRPEDSLHLTNSLPYAQRLEYKAHSKQALAGMVRINVARFKTILRKKLAEMR